MLEERFVAKQSIVDRDGALHGYELLYRVSHENRFPSGFNNQHQQPTLSIIFDHVLPRQKSLDGTFPYFINVDSSTIFKDWIDLLNPSSLVVEILETCHPTQELLNRLKELKN